MSSITKLVIPMTVIVGMIVLMAMGKIDTATGVGLIGVVAGVHGGAQIVNNSSTPFPSGGYFTPPTTNYNVNELNRRIDNVVNTVAEHDKAIEDIIHRPATTPSVIQ